MEWQPIATAPQDGTLVDLWAWSVARGWHRLVDCHWKDGWVSSAHAYILLPRITHWMRVLPPERV